MYKIKCPVCGSSHTMKNGKRKGVQLYVCGECRYQFRNRNEVSAEELWRCYLDGKQTVSELSAAYGLSPSTIKRRHFCKQLRRKPILLFNEADAVINTRSQLATHSVDKMENTMQNIILQEMEQFDGIMIATTNLAQNMDPAFERRFLYKILFEHPDAQVRQHLWQEMVPELGSEECQALGEEFDLSGGQIENVARKYAINAILNAIEPSNRLTELYTLCREECVNHNQSTRPQVGFVA